MCIRDSFELQQVQFRSDAILLRGAESFDEQGPQQVGDVNAVLLDPREKPVQPLAELLLLLPALVVEPGVVLDGIGGYLLSGARPNGAGNRGRFFLPVEHPVQDRLRLLAELGSVGLVWFGHSCTASKFGELGVHARVILRRFSRPQGARRMVGFFLSQDLRPGLLSTAPAGLLPVPPFP